MDLKKLTRETRCEYYWIQGTGLSPKLVNSTHSVEVTFTSILGIIIWCTPKLVLVSTVYFSYHNPGRGHQKCNGQPMWPKAYFSLCFVKFLIKRSRGQVQRGLRLIQPGSFYIGLWRWNKQHAIMYVKTLLNTKYHMERNEYQNFTKHQNFPEINVKLLIVPLVNLSMKFLQA